MWGVPPLVPHQSNNWWTPVPSKTKLRSRDEHLICSTPSQHPNTAQKAFMIYPKTSKNGFTSRWRETPCIIFLLKKLVSVQKTKFPLNEVNFPVTSRTSRAAPQQGDAAAPGSSRTQRRTGKPAGNAAALRGTSGFWSDMESKHFETSIFDVVSNDFRLIYIDTYIYWFVDTPVEQYTHYFCLDGMKYTNTVSEISQWNSRKFLSANYSPFCYVKTKCKEKKRFHTTLFLT